MKHYGDITKLSGYTLPVVDVITGGSPCQDLSVAGKRAGLDGERSGLFMEQVRITKEMREHDRSNGRTGDLVRPRYMVWENVPGAFSSNGGKDFQAVLTEIVRIAEPEAPDVPLPDKGKWDKSGAIFGLGKGGYPFSIAWRVHDAQFWGVPQRRKRIALVADFGGLTASEILFERKGLSGDSEPCGEAREETAGATGGGVEGASIGFTNRGYESGDVTETIRSDPHGAYPMVAQVGVEGAEPILLESNQNHATVQTDGISTTLPASMGMGGGYVPMVTQSVGVDVYNQEITGEVAASLTAACGGTNTSGAKVLSAGFKPRQGAAARSLGFEQEMSPTINTDENYAVLCLNDQGGSVMGVSHDVTGSLRAQEHGHQPVVTAYPIEGNGARPSHQGPGFGDENDPSFTLNSIERHGVATAYGISSYDSNAMKSPNPHSGIYEADTARTNKVPTVFNARYIDTTHADDVVRMDNTAAPLQARDYKGGKLVYDARGNGDGKTVCTITGDHQNRVTDYTALCVGNGQLNQMSMAEQANTLDTMHDQRAVLCGNPWDPQSERVFHGDGAWHSLAGNSGGGQSRDAVMVTAVDCRNGTENPDTNGTLQAKENGGQSLNYQNTVRCGAIVRRLTPLECERLQGYPDGWTDIGEWVDSKGKKHKDADSPRYKALGNSVALPFWQWMARRICAQYERNVTMGSLFDGIGGFPLVFERCGAKAVWASEIEEFCVAVTRERFGEN